MNRCSRRVLAALLRIGATPVAVAAFQAVLGALTCIAIWDLTRRLFGPPESILAGAWAALFGPFLIYSIAFESDALG